jgi:signal transduction histidine kinase
MAMSGASMLGSAWNSASASFDIAFRPRFHMLCFGLCKRLGLEMLILRVQGRLDNHQIHAIRRKLTILKALRRPAVQSPPRVGLGAEGIAFTRARRRRVMMERGMAVAFLPVGVLHRRTQGGWQPGPDGERKPHRRDLVRAVDLYATVLAMASHDLRQPLQVIVGAHELLARRLTAGPEREHLERGERASAELEEKLDELVDALQLHQCAGRIEPEPVRLEPIFRRLALHSSTDRRGARGSISGSCRRAL